MRVTQITHRKKAEFLIFPGAPLAMAFVTLWILTQ